MKKLFVFTFCLLPSAFCLSQSWQWAKKFGGISSNADILGAFCLDSSGNSYLTGSFYTPKGIFGNDTLSVVGPFYDGFIVKIDKDGNFIWAEKAGGNDPIIGGVVEGGTDILYDKSDNSIIFCGNINSNSPSIDSCSLPNGSYSFLSKLDTSGKCIWAWDEITEPGAGKIVLDNNGDIYMVGYIDNSAFVNTMPVQSLPPGGFLAKFNGTTGYCTWAKKIAGYNSGGSDISFYNNKLYIVGISFNDTLTLDTAIAYCYPNDIFISEFDTAGNVQWVKTMGGPDTESTRSLSLDGIGNIYITGIFKDTAYFGSTILSNGNNKDWFLAKYTNTGNFIWVRQAHISGNFYSSHSVSSDANGNTYSSGAISGNAVFGTYSVTANTATDLFVAKYDSTGNCMGVLQANNYGYNGYADIIADNIGGFYVTGVFNDSTTFGNYTLTTCGSCTNNFIAKHDGITGIQSFVKNSNNQLLIYANPNEGKCNITIPDDFLNEKNLVLSIYDNTGKLIQQKTLQMNDGKIKLDLEAEAKGVYNVTLSGKTKTYSGKIVFE